MLRHDNKSIAQVAIGTRLIAEIRLGTQLVYTAIRSCFGSGRWIREKPWLGSEPWKR